MTRERCKPQVRMEGSTTGAITRNTTSNSAAELGTTFFPVWPTRGGISRLLPTIKYEALDNCALELESSKIGTL